MSTEQSKPAETEMAQVSYRETQYGIRLPSGQIESVAIGPAEARRYREAGVDLHERNRVDFLPTVSEWRDSTPTPDLRATARNPDDLEARL